MKELVVHKGKNSLDIVIRLESDIPPNLDVSKFELIYDFDAICLFELLYENLPRGTYTKLRNLFVDNDCEEGDFLMNFLTSDN